MGHHGTAAILTARESQVAERIAWGASQKEVAADLGISRYTVDNILRKVYDKLHIGKINELVVVLHYLRHKLRVVTTEARHRGIVLGVPVYRWGGDERVPFLQVPHRESENRKNCTNKRLTIYQPINNRTS